MQLPSKSSPRSVAPSLQFFCNSCGTALNLPSSEAGVSGPCPKCNHWIDTSTMFQAPPEDVIPKSSRSFGSSSGRGRIQADGFIDHEHNERKELFVTLRILAIALGVFAIILFVTLYMKEWGSK